MVSGAIVNHGILDVCSILATNARVQILRQLCSLVEWHKYWDKAVGEFAALAKQLNELCNGSLRKYLSSGGLFGCRVHLCVHI